jgi:hypothetical protein
LIHQVTVQNEFDTVYDTKAVQTDYFGTQSNSKLERSTADDDLEVNMLTGCYDPTSDHQSLDLIG